MMHGDLSICSIDKSNCCADKSKFQIAYFSLEVLYNQTKVVIKILIIWKFIYRFGGNINMISNLFYPC